MKSNFFAILSRMKYINRWGLMRNTRSENLSEHSHEVAVLAHCLAVIRNRRFGGRLDPAKAAVYGLFHDAAEIITGDMPTPVKYHNPEIKRAYRQVEKSAQTRLLALLPEDMREDYSPLLDDPPDEYKTIIKAADKLSALIKCCEEENQGNSDFSKAKEASLCSLREMKLPETDCFIEEFLPGYLLTLDELD